MWLENEVRLTNLLAMGNSCFWVIWGCWYQKLTFPVCTVAHYPRNWTLLWPNGFKVGMSSMSSNHVNMGIKLKVDESTYTLLENPGPLRGSKREYWPPYHALHMHYIAMMWRPSSSVSKAHFVTAGAISMKLGVRIPLPRAFFLIFAIWPILWPTGGHLENHT
jgi:hypothetical protein